MNAQKQAQDALQGQLDFGATVSPQGEAPVRIASDGDLLNHHPASPARQYQAWLEQAWEEPPQQRFSLGARAAIIAGSSAALWVGIAWLIYLAVR